MPRFILFLVLVLSLTFELNANTHINDELIGKKWALLIAGSRGYLNYRHQADVCHAYQILKRSGFPLQNIIVFMSDDIADNFYNPRHGIIINGPNEKDVYAGIKVDYSFTRANVQNLYAVLMGNRSALTPDTTSDKVLDSGPDDNIFIYYSDHGSPIPALGMPENEYVYAWDLIEVLRKKHDAQGYRKMVIYVEACFAGKMFDGLLNDDLNIYVNTASDAFENSLSTYCPGKGAPWDFGVCIGNQFSVSWLEESESCDWGTKTLQQLFETARSRTTDSHVSEYGTTGVFSNDTLQSFFGVKYPGPPVNRIAPIPNESPYSNCGKWDLELFTYKFEQAPEGSQEKMEALDAVNQEIANHIREDQNMRMIVTQVFGSKTTLDELQTTVRPRGQAFVDDLDCLKSLVTIYKEHCGALSVYGRKYMHAMGNMCNANVKAEEMTLAASHVCGK